METRIDIDAQIERINDWLQNASYEPGLRLYERLIGADFTLRMLQAGPDDYNWRQLENALLAKLSQLEADRDAQQSAYPEQLTSQLDQAKLLMDERTILKERLRGLYRAGIFQTEESAGWAFRILAIKAELDRIYGRKRFYDSHGFLAEDTGLESDQASLIARRNNVRTYLTKYKQALDGSLDEAKRAKYKKKYNQFLVEVHDLDTQLSAIQST